MVSEVELPRGTLRRVSQWRSITWRGGGVHPYILPVHFNGPARPGWAVHKTQSTAASGPILRIVSREPAVGDASVLIFF